jgi:hypothetical protein
VENWHPSVGFSEGINVYAASSFIWDWIILKLILSDFIGVNAIKIF